MPEEIVTMQDGRKIIAMVSRLPADSHCTEGDCRNPTSSTLRDLPVCRSFFDEMRVQRDEARADERRYHTLAEHAQEERARLRALLREVAHGGVELEDARIGYVTVQVDADTWASLKREGRDG